MSISEQSNFLLERIRQHDKEALGELFTLHHERLARLLSVHLDRRLAGRLAPDDVLQDTFLEVDRRIGEYLADPKVPFYVWLRFLALQQVQIAHRKHLGAQMRSAGLEVNLGVSSSDVTPCPSSESMASKLASDWTSPSQAAIRKERQEQLRIALDDMDPIDREVLALRHFEELGNEDVAHVLGITKDAASKRHLRALQRLKAIMMEPASR